ncbi:MAG: sigma-70 family RNA polymerase sigma factor [Deltaproteobacteria bacterium]|nr:MAG: sigma-70 family RNA polymerase sigma factor [Deltaproteobacteria bacterium]
MTMDDANAEALATLYDAHVDFVHRVVRQLGVPAADAEDVVQDVFVVAVRRYREFRGEAAVRTWLYAIAAHLVRNHRRGAARRERRRIAWKSRTTAEDRHVTTVDTARIDVARLLDRLDEASRALVVLVHLHGMSVKEVARTLGMNANTAQSRLRRARLRLARWMEHPAEETGR